MKCQREKWEENTFASDDLTLSSHECSFPPFDSAEERRGLTAEKRRRSNHKNKSSETLLN